MRNLLVFIFSLFSIIVSSQISTYNKGLKNTTFSDDNWFINKGVETFSTLQTPVGYKKNYDELGKVLNFYGLKVTESEIDESLIDKSVESLHDFQNLSNSLVIEWSVINMVWRTSDNYQINWICNKTINLILIRKIK